MVSVPQVPISTSLMSHSTNHEIAESLFQLEGGSIGSDTCNITGDYNTLVIYDSDSLP